MGRGYGRTSKQLSSAETLFKKRIGSVDDNDPSLKEFSLTKRKQNIKKALKILESFSSDANELEDSEGYLLSSINNETINSLKSIISKGNYKDIQGDEDWQKLQANFEKELQYFPGASRIAALLRPFIFGPREGLCINGLVYLNNKAYPQKLITEINNAAVSGKELLNDPLSQKFPDLNVGNAINELIKDGYFRVEEQIVHDSNGNSWQEEKIKTTEKFLKLQSYIGEYSYG